MFCLLCSCLSSVQAQTPVSVWSSEIKAVEEECKPGVPLIHMVVLDRQEKKTKSVMSCIPKEGAFLIILLCNERGCVAEKTNLLVDEYEPILRQIQGGPEA